MNFVAKVGLTAGLVLALGAPGVSAQLPALDPVVLPPILDPVIDPVVGPVLDPDVGDVVDSVPLPGNVSEPAEELPTPAPDETVEGGGGAVPPPAQQPAQAPVGGAPPQVPGPAASADAKRRAYGRYCKGQSRKRARGERRSAYTRCVTAMAKLASGRAKSPRGACKGLSTKRTGRQARSPFRRCVAAGRQLLRDRTAATQ
jgi:hypothetical protein